MNGAALMLFFFFLVAWFGLRHFYRNAARPIFIESARFDLFALRDELRDIEQSKIFTEDEHQAFRFMENAFNSVIRQADSLSLAGYLYILFKSGLKAPVKSLEFERFEKHAPQELRVLDKKFVTIFQGVLAANSPLLVIGCGLLFLVAICLSKLLRTKSMLSTLKRDAKVYPHIASTNECGNIYECAEAA